jgi:hypothetical protein
MPIARTETDHSGQFLSTRPVDRRVAELANRQHGVVSRAQLAALGLGEGAIRLRMRNGRLHRMHRGVYAVGHRIVTSEGRWLAAVLAGGRGAVLSHGSAAAHWGVRPAGTPVAVTTGRRRRSRPGVRFFRSRLPADETTTHDGIPVTTVPRTLFDLAAVISAGQLARAVAEAEVRRLWDPLSLGELLARHPRRPGAVAIRAVLGGSAGITRSELEDRFLAFAGRAGLLRPATNVLLQVGGRWIEADCVWHDQRLIVELDGRAIHATPSAFERDRARDRALTVAGWRVIRITWRQLRDQPEAIARDLRAALDRPARR